MNTVTFGTGGDYATLTAALSAYDFTTGSVIMRQVGNAVEGDNVITQALDFDGNVCWIKGDSDYSITCTGRFLNINTGKLNGQLYIEGMNYTGSSASYSFFETQNTTGIVADSISIFNNVIDVSASSGSLMSFNGTLNETVYFYNNENTCESILYKSDSSQNVYIEDCLFFCAATSGDLMTGIGATEAAKLSVIRCYITALTTLFNSVIEANVTDIDSEVFTDSASTEVIVGNRSLAFSEVNFNSVTPNNVEYAVPKSDNVMTTTATQGTSIPDHNVGANGVTVTTWAVGPYKPRVYLDLPTGVTAENLQTGVKVSWTNDTVPGYDRTYLYWEEVSVDEAFQTPKVIANAGVTEYEIPYSQLSASNTWYLRVTHGA